MLTSDKVAPIIASAIRDVYEHPTRSGQNADAVELHLWCLHWFWALIFESTDQLRELKYEMLRQEEAPGGLWSKLKQIKPNATFDEGARYVSKHWKGISTALGVPLDE